MLRFEVYIMCMALIWIAVQRSTYVELSWHSKTLCICTLYDISYEVNDVLCTMYAMLYTLYPTRCTLHVVPYTLYPTRYTLHVVPYTLYYVHCIVYMYAVRYIQYSVHNTASIVQCKWYNAQSTPYSFPWSCNMYTTKDHPRELGLCCGDTVLGRDNIHSTVGIFRGINWIHYITRNQI